MYTYIHTHIHTCIQIPQSNPGSDAQLLAIKVLMNLVSHKDTKVSAVVRVCMHIHMNHTEMGSHEYVLLARDDGTPDL